MRENNKDKGRPRLARLPATNAAHDHAEIQTVGGLSAKQSPTFHICHMWLAGSESLFLIAFKASSQCFTKPKAS